VCLLIEWGLGEVLGEGVVGKWALGKLPLSKLLVRWVVGLLEHLIEFSGFFSVIELLVRL